MKKDVKEAVARLKEVKEAVPAKTTVKARATRKNDLKEAVPAKTGVKPRAARKNDVKEAVPQEALFKTTVKPMVGHYKRRKKDVPLEALSKIVVWEEIDDDDGNHEALLRYWGSGEGSLDLVTYLPGIESKFEARREALKRLDKGNDTAVRRRAEEKLKESTPPVRPTEPAFPGLWHLQPWAAVVKLPWDWACDGAIEFRSRWESNVATEAFKLELAQLLYWWTAKWNKLSLNADVRGIVSSALDSLVESCTAEVVYPELNILCAYFQYSKDLATFEDNSKAYLAQLEEEREEALKQAWVEFKRANSRLYEEVTWDWCPFWRILMSSDNVQGLGLPELPWEHNCSESLRVRRALTRSRVELVRPVPLVRVLRILFWSCYGEFRQLTCPIYGLTEHLIVKLCEDDVKLNRILSTYGLQGKNLFTGLECESVKSVRHRLFLEVAQIRDGRGVDTFCSIMSWVRTVQLRAMQDYAAAQASEFDNAWCTLKHELWTDQWEHWGQTLRTREDSDIGWLFSIEHTFPPSTRGCCALGRGSEGDEACIAHRRGRCPALEGMGSERHA